MQQHLRTELQAVGMALGQTLDCLKMWDQIWARTEHGLIDRLQTQLRVALRSAEAKQDLNLLNGKLKSTIDGLVTKLSAANLVYQVS